MIVTNKRSGGLRWLQQLSNVTMIRVFSIFLLFPTQWISITTPLMVTGSQGTKLHTFPQQHLK